MPNYRFSDSFAVFTHKNFNDETRAIAERLALDKTREEHRGVGKSAILKMETYKDRVKFNMSRDDVKAVALNYLKLQAMTDFKVSIKELEIFTPFDGKRAVHLIDEADKNDFDIVGKRAKKGIAIVDVKDDDGKTLLHYAAECGLLSVVRILLKQPGADIDVCDNYQRTPLRLAVEKGVRIDLIRYLIDKGANVNIQDNDGQTLLNIAEDEFKDAPDGEEKKRRDKIKVEIKKEIVRREENKKP